METLVRRVLSAVRPKSVFAVLALSIVVLVAYFPILRVSFVGDDWIFYELAGRLNLSDYLVKYFDPRAQTAWYRPVQGVLFRLWYVVFRADAMWYHLSNVLIHLAAAIALYAVVARAGRSKLGAFVAAVLFASFPTAVEGVFKPGVIDPLTTLFALLAVWFWMAHLRRGGAMDYWLAFAAFLIALYSKEIAVTLPFTLWLVDRFVVGGRSSLWNFLRRYAWFALAILAYLPIEIIVVSRSVFVSREGYSTSVYLLTNLIDYLAAVAFPWQLPAPTSYVWLALAAALLAYLVIAKRVFALLPLIANAILAILPILPFPFVTYRFAYMSLVSSATLLALAFEWVWRNAPARWGMYLCGGALALAVGVGSVGVANAAADFGEFARVTRVPFRNVSQAHPTFPEDTLLYFVNPPLPGPNLSGMFFWRYGARVTVGADDMPRRAGLRDHAHALVYIFDAQGNQKELRVEKEIAARATPALPATFTAPLGLEGYELVSANVKSDEAIVLILYWRALSRIEKDYTVSVHLFDAGESIAGYEKEPRRGRAPTSAWLPGDLIVDAIQLPLARVQPGTYRLTIGLYDPASARRLQVLDARGQVIGDQIVVEPVRILE